MRWFRLRRGQTKHVTVRLPADLAQRLDDRARLEDKTATDVITEALEDLLSAPSVTVEDSVVMRAARQIKELEDEVRRLEREEAYVDAKENLDIISLPADKINWFDANGQWATKEKALKGQCQIGKRWVKISLSEYDQWVKDKPVLERIVADYEGRMQSLKDKIQSLKAGIVKSGVENVS